MLTPKLKVERHFEDPTSTSITWLALLFGVITMAMQSYHRTNTMPPDIVTAATLLELYRIRTLQCIQIADIARPVSVPDRICASLFLTGYFRATI